MRVEENSSQPAQPVSGRERVVVVDVLRGFAILGILMVNIYGLSGMFLDPGSRTDRLDRLVIVLIILLFQAKFYSLFSFLFGWGMSIQLRKAIEKGTRFSRLYIRRMLILLFIGLFHGLLIWSGDILTVYAIFGLGLLVFRNKSRRSLLLWVILFLLFSMIVLLPGQAMDEAREVYARATNFMRSDSLPAQSIFGQGTYGQITDRRIGEFISGQSWFVYWLGNVFGMMLLGLYAGKRGVFRDINRHLPLFRKTLVAGLLIGLIFNAISVWVASDLAPVPAQYQRFSRVSTRTIGAPALMLFYVSGIVLLMQKESWRSRLSSLAPVGRMALSNYLFQSVAGTLIFYGYGLGLYGEISPTFALIMVITIFLIFAHLGAAPVEGLPEQALAERDPKGFSDWQPICLPRKYLLWAGY